MEKQFRLSLTYGRTWFQLHYASEWQAILRTLVLESYIRFQHYHILLILDIVSVKLGMPVELQQFMRIS